MRVTSKQQEKMLIVVFLLSGGAEIRSHIHRCLTCTHVLSLLCKCAGCVCNLLCYCTSTKPGYLPI